MTNRKSIFWFLGISFVFSWTMFLIPLAFKSNPATYAQMTSVFRALGMWGPGLAAIVVIVFLAKEPFGNLRLKKVGRFRYYLAAWFVPPF